MKSEFSKSWNSSKQPRKQVKFRANAPNHIKRTFMASPLDRILKQKFGMNSVEVRKGDEVKIMRGKFKGVKGKVNDVDVKNSRLQVDGAQRSKRGGEKVVTWFHPSKVKIVSLYEEDKKRFKFKKSAESKEEEVTTEKIKKTKTKVEEKKNA